MPSFEQSIISVSGRLTQAWDFTFYKKNNGEIANRVRTELGSSLEDISIDKDGDINIEMIKEGTFIVTPSAVIAAGWLTDFKTLVAQSEVEKFTRIIEVLANAKGSFTTEDYNVRLFFRFRPENSLSLLRDRGFGNTWRTVLGEKAPSDVQSLKFSTRHNKGEFMDSMELEASPKDVQLRYSRSANGTAFDSYHAFLDTADLAGLAEELKPFAEVLVAAEPHGVLGRRSLLSEMK